MEPPEDVTPQRRLNGFERPFHPFQVLAWVVFGIDVCAFAVFGLPLVGEDGARLALAMVYAVSVVVLVIATYRATACDPADPNVLLPPSLDIECDDDAPFCGMCNVPVLARSKHCRACSKCVDVFDHHCMWLNNCIGGSNYRPFFVTISSVSVMIGIILGTCLYLLVDIISGDGFERRVANIAFMESLPTEFFLGLLVAMIVVNGPLFLLDTQLVFLHIFLMSQSLTTYEYIMGKRDQEEKEQEGQADAGSARELEGTQPEDRGNASKRVRTLPHWMDWIVFSRCGRRRRNKKVNTVQRIGDQEETDGEVDKEVQVDSNVAAPTTPPGSTVDAATEGPGGPRSASAGGAAFDAPVPSSARSGGSPPPTVPAAVAHHPGAASGLGLPVEVCEPRALDDTNSSHADSPKVLVAEKLGCGCDKASATRPPDRPALAKL